MAKEEFKIRKRHLSHWEYTHGIYFITFRVKVGDLSTAERSIVLRHIVDGSIDYYDLFAAVVMPDHVHIILGPREKYILSRILKGIKGGSARKVNIQRNARGTLWQGESYDRLIRDYNDLIEKGEYILNNPVRRGLTTNPWDYKFTYFNADIF